MISTAFGNGPRHPVVTRTDTHLSPRSGHGVGNAGFSETRRDADSRRSSARHGFDLLSVIGSCDRD